MQMITHNNDQQGVRAEQMQPSIAEESFVRSSLACSDGHPGLM